MKKIITLLSIISLSISIFGQNNSGLQLLPSTIGFEPEEGYTLGSINNQGSWTVTDNPIFGTPEAYAVTDELSNTGNHSLVLNYDSRYRESINTGAFYHLPGTEDKNVEIYFRYSSSSSFHRMNFINKETQNLGSLIVIQDNKISVRDWERWGEREFDVSLSPDTWYKLNIEFNREERKIDYKIDDVIVYSRSRVHAAGFDYDQIELLHDNSDETTKIFFDDLTFYESEDSVLAVSENNQKAKISVYPNPTTNFVTIKNIEGVVEDITIGDLNGKTVRHIKSTDRKIDLQGLPNGVYLLKIKTDKGLLFEKILKK